MSWWTTILGGTFGFILGGPLGAMLGAAFAGNFSKSKTNFGGFSKDYHLGDQQRVQAAFFSSLFSVMGYLAKVDGKVSKEEILLAQQVMQHMQLADDMQKVAKDLFNQGKQADQLHSKNFSKTHSLSPSREGFVIGVNFTRFFNQAIFTQRNNPCL